MRGWERLIWQQPGKKLNKENQKNIISITFESFTWCNCGRLSSSPRPTNLDDRVVLQTEHFLA